MSDTVSLEQIYYTIIKTPHNSNIKTNLLVIKFFVSKNKIKLINLYPRTI